MNKVKDAARKLRHPGEHDSSGTSPVPAAAHSLTRTASRQSIHTSDPEAATRLKDLLKKVKERGEEPEPPRECVSPSAPFATLKSNRVSPVDRAASTLAQCADPIRIKVLGERVAIDNQIQLYATNAQLRHPWVSPINGYLGGLPPLYILAGDKEVLRDEIIYACVLLLLSD